MEITDMTSSRNYTLSPVQQRALSELIERGSSVLGLQMGVGKCKLGSSRVQTEKGYVPIESLVPNAPEGISPLFLRVSTRKGEFRTTHFYKESGCKVNIFRLSNGLSINGTDQHSILCGTGTDIKFTKMSEIEVGDTIPFPVSPLVHETSADNFLSLRECYNLGLFCSGNAIEDEFISRGWSFVRETFEIMYEGSYNQKLSFLLGYFENADVGRSIFSRGGAFQSLVVDISLSVGMPVMVEEGGLRVHFLGFRNLLRVSFPSSRLHRDLTSIVSGLPDLTWFSGYIPFEVVSRETVVADVYDIEVSRVHEYVSEGFVNHNSLLSLHLADNHLQGKNIFVIPKAARGSFTNEMNNRIKKPYLYISSDSKLTSPQDLEKHDFIFVEHTYLSTCVDHLRRLVNWYPSNLFVDEAQCLQNPKSVLSKNLWSLRSYVKSVYAITGTPLLNSIEGLFHLYRFVYPNKFRSWWNFRSQFCQVLKRKIRVKSKRGFEEREIHEIVGYKNTEMLYQILDDLTIKGSQTYNVNYTNVEVDLEDSKKEAYRLGSHGLLTTETEKDFGARLHDLQRLVDGVPVGGGEVSVSNKARALLDLLTDIISRGEGALVYVEYMDTLKYLKSVLEMNKDSVGYRTLYTLSGSDSESFRLRLEKELGCGDVVIMSQAGRQSRNLQAVNNLIIYNLPFSIGDILQCTGRICRMDSRYSSQNIYILTVRRSIDSYKFILFRDHLHLVESVLGDECKGTLLCDSEAIDRTKMYAIKHSNLWKM